ncbi:helix-turn-helix transcriptional regulator [Herbivorax sp. ANBcel31]|uniref:helix-turn-helix domain-containing protein n=1 Tax=Herbivorax sp. ANBcel31 TaxID=3069754 RepID=UPI0027AFBF82|nr:helix-turn-helix transcriptional regulator [Herbivorax sp. ANBcel31]MDQ2086938.1 helix-turn-helix transcriptional regulator [Herbivorax sp. ANBcel31]
MEIKVGELIKAKREEKKYSLVNFAQIVGITPGYLSQIENGYKKNPKLEILLKIIKELEIDLDMLLGLENSKENLNFIIPPLLKLILAKERNSKVLEHKEVQKKMCDIIDKSLECKYLIENEELYHLFLEDIYIQIETILKRYMAFQIIKKL